MKIVIFGTGKFYQKRKKEISPNIEIVAFIDNNIGLEGKVIDGVEVFHPCKINKIIYDKIVIMSTSILEMKKQLLSLGINEKDIWYWEQLRSEMSHGVVRFCCQNNYIEKYNRKVLIISTDLNYNGGTLAAVYAAQALRDKEFFVILAAPGGNSAFIEETKNKGVNIMICPALPYLNAEELFWIKYFDIILVNVFQMILCACEISKMKPVVWWIHEPRSMYKTIMEQFQNYVNIEKLEKIHIYAVSKVAQANFNYFFENRIKEILAYGIPDESEKNIIEIEKDYLVFAIIGVVCPLKAQDIFMQAAQILKDERKKNVQFWIIGSIGTDKYSNKIREFASENNLFKIYGELTRSEIRKIYKEIDIVVCSSLEDSLPIVITESMMYRKVCIVSDVTGTAKYIIEKVNGLICKAGDILDLAKQMEWVIENRDNLGSIQKNARKTYEKYFSMKNFKEVLSNILCKAIETYNVEN